MGNPKLLDWLLEGEPFVVYRTRLDLLGQAETNDEVKSARAGMIADGKVQSLITELGDWPWKVIASHKSAGQLFHKLTFLADLGLNRADPGVEPILKTILESQSEEGAFQLPINIPVHYGGTGQEGSGWALCDTPLLMYALVKMGYGEDPRVQKAAGFLASLARANGWPCAVSKSLGSFRGPGRKEDPCPYATLAMLKALAEMPEWRESGCVRDGSEELLKLWTNSRAEHPYIFYMGTDFRKLKIPFIWYDLVHVLEVLTRFTWLRGDPRLRDMADVLLSKADPEGKFTVESAWQAWKEWEFGQKRLPSRWLTLAAWRIRDRLMV